MSKYTRVESRENTVNKLKKKIQTIEVEFAFMGRCLSSYIVACILNDSTPPTCKYCSYSNTQCL